MNNQNWDSMNDMEFDSMLVNSVAELPPDDVVNEVTPWREAVDRIIIGIALNIFTLKFWGLNYILPTIGIILSLLGFRSLRRENAWFKACWFIILIRAAYFLPTLVLDATILRNTAFASPISGILTALNMALILMLFFCLWRSFITVKQKANLPAHAGAAIKLIVWYVIICTLALLQYNGLVVVVIMITSYIRIIRNLFKLPKELDEAGYAIQTAPVRIPDWKIVSTIIGFITVGIICGYLFFSSYPMEWKIAKTSEDETITEIKEHLIELGFPKTILEDLSAKDIMACEGALGVVVKVSDHPTNDNRPVEKSASDSIYSYIYSDVEHLRITGIGVELPGEREQWKIFHHFLWTVDPGFYGTESIQLVPPYGRKEGWESVGDITGRVLYDKNGQVYVAPFYSLSNETYTSNSIFLGKQTSTRVFASFSMPREGENHRGYLSYNIKEVRDKCVLLAIINYTHQRSWIQYPVMTAREKSMTTEWIKDEGDGAFKTIQDRLHFYPCDEVLGR